MHVYVMAQTATPLLFNPGCSAPDRRFSHLFKAATQRLATEDEADKDYDPYARRLRSKKTQPYSDLATR